MPACVRACVRACVLAFTHAYMHVTLFKANLANGVVYIYLVRRRRHYLFIVEFLEVNVHFECVAPTGESVAVRYIITWTHLAFMDVV